MSNKTKDWRLTNIKLYKEIEDEKPFCLASLKYYSIDFKKSENIIFYRNLRNQKSYFSWKIILIDNLVEENNNINQNTLKNDI